MLAFVSYPLLKDLTINLLSIVLMFVSNSTDPVIVQEEEAKLIVLLFVTILPFLPGNWTHSPSVGRSAWSSVKVVNR